MRAERLEVRQTDVQYLTVKVSTNKRTFTGT